MKKTENNSFGSRLRRLRTEKNMTQTMVGQKIGCRHSSVANWEGNTRFPTPDTVKKLAKLFDVSVEYLYGTTTFRNEINAPKEYGMDFSQLNSLGREKIKEYFDMLVCFDKYTK